MMKLETTPVGKTAEDGMFAVEVAKLATSKASSQEVKAFASMMVEDHAKANSELARLANAKGVELPAGPPHGKRREIGEMGKMDGPKFDKAFAHEVGIEDHQKDIKMFEKGSRKAQDAELRAWIGKTLPTLRTHLAAASMLPQNNKAGKAELEAVSYMPVSRLLTALCRTAPYSEVDPCLRATWSRRDEMQFVRPGRLAGGPWPDRLGAGR